EALPFASSSFDTVLSVWMLQLVGDLPAAVAEMARVLRPDGRLLCVLNSGAPFEDDIEAALGDLWALVGRPKHDLGDVLIRLGAGIGLVHLESTLTTGQSWELSPAAEAEQLERR